MACGDVLSLEDLQTAKKHQIFEAEVITGKAGGVAGGASIDYATNPVTGQTQQTLPSILADLGFDVQPWTSSTGGVLASANQVFLNDTLGSLGVGDYYAWGGAFPKTVPAGTDPALVGGGYIMRSSRFAGTQAREALRRSYAEAGYNLVDGSFEAGGTLVNANDALLQERTGKAFSGPAGPVAAGTDPASGWFVDRSGEILRDKLALANGAGMVGTLDGRTVQERFDNIPAEVDAAGTAAALIAQHNASATAHPALSKFITQEANRAEQAAEAAATNGKIYTTSADGQADTTLAVNAYFWVVSASAANILELWKKGVSTPTDTGKRTIESTYIKGQIEGQFAVDITGPLIAGQLIDATNGSIADNTNYSRTDYVAVSGLESFLYKGKATVKTGLAFYDSNKQYVSGIYPISQGVYTVPAGVAWLRACTDKRIESALAIMKRADSGTVTRLDAESKAAQVDLVSAPLSENYITSSGGLFPSSLYRATDYIPISDNSLLYYTGRFDSSSGVVAVAMYDANKSYIGPLFGSSAVGRNFVSKELVVSNPNVKYIRACSSINSPAPFSLKTAKYNSFSDVVYFDVIAKPISATSFEVEQYVGGGEYISHIFNYVDDALRVEKGWYSTWVRHRGIDIAQGNTNFIHLVANRANEGAYVGMGHGCEIQRWSSFFVDGKPFDPSQGAAISGSRFHFMLMSDVYAADQTKESGDRTRPKLPLELSTVHYMDCEITRDGMRRYNKLVVKRDNTVFSQLFAAMQQTNQPAINGTITINRKEPCRIHFPVSPDAPEYLAPDTGSFGKDFVIPWVDKVTAEGVSNGYNYVIETSMENLDNAAKRERSIRSWCGRASSNKFYFTPFSVTSSAGAVGIPARVFNIGDVIEASSHTRYDIKKT